MLGRKLAGSELGRLADSCSRKYRKSTERLIYMRRRSRYAVSENSPHRIPAIPLADCEAMERLFEIIREIILSINLCTRNVIGRESLLGSLHRSADRQNKQGARIRDTRGKGEEGRRPDLFMNAEIPRGSLGVPKHQRDCVPSRRYSITGLSEYPHPFLHPPSRWTLCYTILAIHATGHRHANEYL